MSASAVLHVQTGQLRSQHCPQSVVQSHYLEIVVTERNILEVLIAIATPTFILRETHNIWQIELVELIYL